MQSVLTKLLKGQMAVFMFSLKIVGGLNYSVLKILEARSQNNKSSHEISTQLALLMQLETGLAFFREKEEN